MRWFLVLLAVTVPVWAQAVDWIDGVKSKPLYDVRQYDWLYPTGSKASGNLSVAGAGKTVLLKPCPPGLVYGNGAMPVYISAGTGTAEVVALTALSSSGGNCTATFTTVNTHTGSWRIGSATAGLKEASESLANADPVAGCVYLPAGTYRPRATVTGIGQPRFCGNEATVYPTFVNDDVFRFIYSAGPSFNRSVQIDGIRVSLSTYATVGTAFHLEGYTDGVIKNVECNNTFICLDFYANNTGGGNPVVYDGIIVRSNQGVGMRIRSTGTGQVAGILSNIYIGSIGAVPNTIGMQLSGLHAGWTANNIWMQHNSISLDIVGVTANDAWMEGTFNNMVLDQDASVLAPTANIRITGPGGVNQIANGFTISNSLMQTGSFGILATDVRNAKFINNTFSIRGTVGGVVLDDCQEIDIAGNRFNIAGTAVPNAIVLQNLTRAININGNSVANSLGGHTLGNFLSMGATAISDIFVSGNQVKNTTMFISNASSVVPAVKIAANDFAWPTATVASAATITLPDVPDDSVVVISGATDITRILGGYPGRRVRFLFQGALNLNTGGTNPGNIAAVVGPTAANQIVLAAYESGSGIWYLK